jgi:porin
MKKKNITLACFLVLAFGVGGFSMPVQAEETGTHVHKMPPAPESWGEAFKEIWDRDKLTGDWASDLHDHGLDVNFRLSQYYQNVASGGVNENGEYGGTMDYRVTADAKKVFGLWEGLSFTMHARTRFGEDINADAGGFVLPNAGMLMPAPGDFHGTEITGLTGSQYLPFFYGRLANVTLGQLDVVDTVNGFFPHIGYGQEGFMNIHSQVSALPWFGAVQGLSLYGGIGVTINQEYKIAESGFLVIGTENESTSWGSLGNAFDEVWLAGFHRFLWDVDDKMGYFMVFAGGSTKGQPSNEKHDFAVIPGQGITDKEKKPWDVALYLYQDFWQAEGNSDRKATLFIGGTVGPDNPQFAQYNLFASVEVFGLMASRPHDRVGVAWWKNWLSDNYKDLVSPVIDLQNLWGVEFYYNIALNKWLHLTPALQLVENERKRDDLAVIPGVRLVMDF